MDFDNEDMESESGYIVSGFNIGNGDGVGFGGQVCANVWGSIFGDGDGDGVGFDVGYNIDEIDNGVGHEIGLNMSGSVVGDIDCVRAKTCPHVGGVMLWVILLLIYVVITWMMKRKKIKIISLLMRKDLIL